MCLKREKGEEHSRTEGMEIQKRLEAYLFLEIQTGETKVTWIGGRKTLRLVKKDESYEYSDEFLSSPVVRVKRARVWLRETNKDEKEGLDAASYSP